ncbi:WSC domain-containing protein 2 isoform X2 [Nematostella vectensis]|nr:WSC domain-containing protein 2 isoform X2 [Nematostella vectensis]
MIWTVVVTSSVPLDLYLGCYIDTTDRDLPYNTGLYSDLTPVKCIEICRVQGYIFAAAQNANSCFCGNSYGKHGKASDTDCSKACTGNSNLKCGGQWRASVYRVVTKLSQYIGCYKESSRRDLWGDKSELNGTVSAQDVCIQRCKAKGFHFAAINDYTVCNCGVSYGRYGKAVSPKDCNPKCSGGEHCSTTNANTIYRTESKIQPLARYTTVVYSIPEGSVPLLRDHVIYTETSVNNVTICLQYCELLPACVSINHNSVTMVCEMNNVTSSTGRGAARENFIYWEPMKIDHLTLPLP